MSMLFQAITTRYIGPTNTRGSRIKAKAAAGSVTIAYDQSLGTTANHAAAAKALADKMGWRGQWYAGGMPDDQGNVFVCVLWQRDAPPRDDVAFVSFGEH